MGYKLRGGSTWTRNVGKYKLTYNGHTLYCSCPAWKYQRIPSSHRVCKHIEQHYPEYAPVPDLYPSYRKEPPDFFLLADLADPADLPNVQEFYWSEKYDGVRAMWDGEYLVTRSGRTVRAPREFLDGLPDGVHLDGELWAGRGNFESVRTSLDVGPPHTTWQRGRMRFMVFDSPQWPDEPFSERYQRLLELDDEYVSCTAVQQHHTTSVRKLTDTVRQMSDGGAEGVVLRHPTAMYRKGRNRRMALKYKLVMYGNGDVVDEVAGAKNSYMVRVDEPPESEQQVITLNLAGHDSIAVGDHVVFSYRGLTSKMKPKYAKFVESS